MSNRVGLSLAGKRTALIAYYEGAYGPTLRIDLQSLESLAEIKAAIEGLGSGHTQRIRLDHLGSIVMEPPVKSVSLVALPSPTRRRRHQTVKKNIGADGTLAFEWTQGVTEWEDTAALIDGLAEAGQRGLAVHQYLTETDGKVLIEMALNELQ